jgi:hypothetical protein
MPGLEMSAHKGEILKGRQGGAMEPAFRNSGTKVPGKIR